MKRILTAALCLMLTVTPVLAESMVTPMPPADSDILEISLPQTAEKTIVDVLNAWKALADNQTAYALLDSSEQTLSSDTLLRLLTTYCMEANADTTWEIMLDYEPMISVVENRVHVNVMTHAVGFSLVLDAGTGNCIQLEVDEDGGNG